MQKKRNKPDLVLVATIVLLVFLGILVLASVSASFSRQKTGSTLFFLNHQLLFGLLPGLVLGGIAYMFSLKLLKKKSPLLLLGSLAAMGAVFLPVVGGASGGASRWILLGSFSFQPSELFKLAFIIYLAAWLDSRMEKRNFGKGKSPEFWQTLLPFLAILGVAALLLIAQPDLGTLIVLALIASIMYFSAKTPISHILALGGLGIAAVLLLIKVAPYRMARIQTFLDPSLDPLGSGYQIKQALISIGSGGLFGRGLGLSVQKFGFLPQPMSDSIFAVFSEEAGFIGASLFVLLFLAFALRGYFIAAAIKDRFPQLLAVGIVSWISIQAFVNIGALAGILPLTGIPLPFVSYGGSALVSELIAIGLLLNASREQKT
ncbi:MAG: putative lipid II flippase FtsW [Parcubacteria group bacterium]|nr:putative lipid II flippase FtsW [Parcubacteria group bacterium]